jgi:hypothetical protein
MADTRYCIDCAHFKLPHGPTDMPVCEHESAATIPDQSAVANRQEGSECGPDGVYWMRKENV